jgi:hypothetical protein
MGSPASKIGLGAVVLEQPQLNAAGKELMRSFKITGVTGHSSPKTWNRAQCSTGDDSKLGL